MLTRRIIAHAPVLAATLAIRRDAEPRRAQAAAATGRRAARPRPAPRCARRRAIWPTAPAHWRQPPRRRQRAAAWSAPARLRRRARLAADGVIRRRGCC